MNIQPSTSNDQHPVLGRAGCCIGGSLLAVGCWMFLFFLIPALSISAQTSTNALPPLAPPYPEIPPTFWQQECDALKQHPLIIPAIALSLAAVVGGFWRQRLKRKTKPVLAPETVARQALEKLAGQIEDGNTLSEVSQILRRYVAAAGRFPDGELTTGELIASLAETKNINTDLAEAIGGFLRECDARKFSAATQTEPFHAVARALEMVTLVETAHREAADRLIEK